MSGKYDIKWHEVDCDTSEYNSTTGSGTITYTYTGSLIITHEIGNIRKVMRFLRVKTVYIKHEDVPQCISESIIQI
jgi:hypothetical protein